MRTSRKYLDLNYIQILPNTQTQAAMTTPEISNTKNETGLNAYQKHNLNLPLIKLLVFTFCSPSTMMPAGMDMMILVCLSTRMCKSGG